MIYIVNNKFRTAKSQIYLGNVGLQAKTIGKKQEYIMTPSTEPEETSAVSKFAEQIAIAPATVQQFIENVIESFETVRGGSVCLNRFWAFSKWFSALVKPPLFRVSAG